MYIGFVYNLIIVIKNNAGRHLGVIIMNNGIHTALPATQSGEKDVAQKALSKPPTAYIEKPVTNPPHLTLVDIVDQLLLSASAEGVAKNAKASATTKLLQLIPIPTEGGVPMLIIDSIGSVSPGMSVDPTKPMGQDGGKSDMMASIKQPPEIKSLVELMPGQSFSAEILDIKPGAVTLKMGDGMPLTARSMVVPDARIGDQAAFMVRETKPGQIMLEFLRGGIGEGNKVPVSIIKEALTAANMQHTNLNASIIEDLVSRNMPIDTSTLQRVAFFKYSMPQAPFEHIQFLLENNFAPIDRTVEIFEGMQKGEMTLKSEMTQIASLLESPEFVATQKSEALEGLINQLKNLQPPTTGEGQMPQPAEYLEQLKNITQEISQLAQQEGQTELAQKTANVADMIDFARNIQETKMYLQFPFLGASEEQLAELHVFKKKGEKKEGVGKNTSALIALDTGFLGRVEVFVQKNDRNVSLQFRSDTGETLRTVNLKGHELSDMLKEVGYVMTSLQTKRLEEKFDVTKTQETIQPTKYTRRNPPPTDDTPKRYSFDVRV